MNNKYMAFSLFSSLLLASPLVAAEAQYPASEFQPKVVFQDADQIAQHKSNATSSSSGQGTSAAASPADAKYPAADFQPKVLFKDENYKPSPSTSTSAASYSSQSSTAVEEESAASKKAEKKQGGSNWIVLVLLAIAGAIFYSRRSKSTDAGTQAEAGARTSYAEAGGLTGVAKYINKTSGTGVSRYLEKQSKTETPATGVAKYMAKQAVSAKSGASEAATGVEKYMRKRG